MLVRRVSVEPTSPPATQVATPDGPCAAAIRRAAKPAAVDPATANQLSTSCRYHPPGPCQLSAELKPACQTRQPIHLHSRSHSCSHSDTNTQPRLQTPPVSLVISTVSTPRWTDDPILQNINRHHWKRCHPHRPRRPRPAGSDASIARPSNPADGTCSSPITAEFPSGRGPPFSSLLPANRVHSGRRDDNISTTAVAVTELPSALPGPPFAIAAPGTCPFFPLPSERRSPRGRSTDGRVPDSVPTASHASTSHQPSKATAVGAADEWNLLSETLPAQPNPLGQWLFSLDAPPPLDRTTIPAAPAVVAAPHFAAHARPVGTDRPTNPPHLRQQPPVNAGGRTDDRRRLHAAFRSRAASPSPSRPRRPGAARLWNPTNSTPRLLSKPTRKRRPSTPPLPAVPLYHPTIGGSNAADPVSTGAGDHPLLTLSEQRQTKHPVPSRPSLQIDHRGASEKRISLPLTVRQSYDEKRAGNPTPTPTDPELTWAYRQSIHEEGPYTQPYADKGKGREIMANMPSQDEDSAAQFSADLERGPEPLEHHPRPSNVSDGDGIGSPISSSDSSIMGEDVQGDATLEWGPQHPCFPHLNPYVPVTSPEYVTTRIIRVRRDFMVEGDVAPTFSDTYPDILDPVGLSEQEFRRVIEKLNGDLVRIHSPYSVRNVLDGVLGLLTGWVWDDLGFTGIKARLAQLETWIERWNEEMEKTLGADEGVSPKIIPLRMTGYMTLDIQIPDPEIAPAPSSTHHGGSREGYDPEYHEAS